MQKFIRNLSANIITADFILAFLFLSLTPFLEGYQAFRSSADFYGYFILFPAIAIYVLLQKIADRMELKSKSREKKENSEAVIAASQILPVHPLIFSKPVQLSLGVAAGPQQELFDQPKREEIRYHHSEPEVFMIDGEPPIYKIDIPTPTNESKLIKGIFKKFGEKNIISIREKNGGEIWPLSETRWERKVALELKGITCPNCDGIDLGIIIYGQLVHGDGKLNHLMRMKLLILGGCIVQPEDLYCNDCENYWVSGKRLNEN